MLTSDSDRCILFPSLAPLEIQREKRKKDLKISPDRNPNILYKVISARSAPIDIKSSRQSAPILGSHLGTFCSDVSILGM